MKDAPSSTTQAEQRRLAAIMFTDIVGFSRQMGADEARMLRLLDVHNQLIQQAVTQHHGTVIKTVGDAFLVDFPSVVHAVQCAQQIQSQLRVHNAEKVKAEQIHVRIGIHLGDIVQREGDVFGDGVNIASRLQGLAEPDTTCISHVVYKEVEKKLPLGTVVSLGRPKLKNITEQFQVYALLPEQPKGFRQTLQVQRLKLSRRVRPAHRAVAGGVLLAGAILLVWYLAFPTPNTQHPTPSTQSLPLPDKPSIVVLPFVNLSGDPGQEYFSDGITEDLTTDLSQISSLFVIARNSAFTYKGKAVRVEEVGRDLGVRYVLEGSMRKADDRVRINAQLIDATTGYHLWAERYDRPLQDLFALHDEIVQKIVRTISHVLTSKAGIMLRKGTDNPEAYDAYLRGQEHYWRTTKEANLQARRMYEQAVALDPQYAQAYASLGATYYVAWVWRWSQEPQTLERALAMAQRSIALDSSQPVAHGLLAMIYAQKKQYERAVAEGERAIALDPNSAYAYASQAEALNHMGRPEEALRAVEQAMRLNPHYPAWYVINSSMAYYLLGRYAEAVSALKSLLAQNPNWQAAYFFLSSSYALQYTFQLSPDLRMLEQAAEAAQQGITLNDSSPWSHLALGYVHLLKKEYEQALAEMERAIAVDPHMAESYCYANVAEALSYAGRPGEALRAVEQALGLSPVMADLHLAGVGVAYALAGRPEEAVAPLRRYLSRYPNILGAHLTLAAVYSELGKEAEARSEAAEVLRLNPKFSLEVHKERAPIKDPAMLERHIAALRKAGLK